MVFESSVSAYWGKHPEIVFFVVAKVRRVFVGYHPISHLFHATYFCFLAGTPRVAGCGTKESGCLRSFIGEATRLPERRFWV